jgi:hypothetical protein
MSITSLNNGAGLIVLGAYPVILLWILINQVRRRRLLSFRTLPDADSHITEARRRYAAAIGEAGTRLLTSESHLQREGITESQNRLRLLEDAKARLIAPRRLAEKLLLSRSQAVPYLVKICAMQNLSEFEELQRLVDTLINRERALIQQLQSTLHKERA